MEFVIGGMAAVFAGFFTNPLEVIKTRMQLQGELQARGKYAVHYRNIAQAAYQIAKHDGVLALQKGLVPALWVQLIMNGARFGFYDFAYTRGYGSDAVGNKVLSKCVVISGFGGVIGHYLSNPFYMIKTHLQAEAARAIAVGHQHHHEGTRKALQKIYRERGFTGLFRAGVAVIPRAFVASSSQLMSFIYCKEWLSTMNYFQHHPITISFVSSMIGGVAISVMTTPFDLVLTRLYNQALDEKGKGVHYSSYVDCVVKVYKAEGISAFYKGVGPMYFRLGPHSVLCLMFWDYFRELYAKFAAVQNKLWHDSRGHYVIGSARMDFVVGGLAAAGASVFSNPLDVLKTRMQLQGELKARGQHAVHYRNVFHAALVVVKHDGLFGLQKGLGAAMFMHCIRNSVRLGSYQWLNNKGYLTDAKGNTIFTYSFVASALCGAAGAFFGSPLFLIKTQLQSQAAKSIAVGHQHGHMGAIAAIKDIYSSHGIRGLWRGCAGTMVRALAGSSAQLASFAKTKEYLREYEVFNRYSVLNSLVSSVVGGVFQTLFMQPFDLVSVRLYNQGVDSQGRGLLYGGIADCFMKTFKAEGLLGFYKGVTANYVRLAPHGALCLVFWDILKDLQEEHLNRKPHKLNR